jgi:alpha-L-fucosidase
LVPDTDAKNAAGLHAWIQKTFSNNLAKGSRITTLHPRGSGFEPSSLVDHGKGGYYASADGFNEDTITFELGSTKTFDCLMIQEVIQLGQRTTGWSVESSSDGVYWTPVPGASEKQSIGHKWIARFPPITASYVRLRLEGRVPAAIRSFGIYKQARL